MSDSPLAREIELLESFSKALAVLVAVLYLAGFVVVAFHLSRFGVSTFDMLHLQYLIAGIWVLVPQFLAEILKEIEQRFNERASPYNQKEWNWYRFVLSSLFSTLPATTFLILLVSVPGVTSKLGWKTGIEFFLFWMGMWIFASSFWKAYRVDPANETWSFNRTHAAPFYFSLLFVLVFGYALWFSSHIYPLIPFTLGGGKPLTVAFFEGETKLPDEILKPSASAKRSIPYKLLLTTDKYFVVVSPSDNERSLQISRDSVAGIVVLSAN